MPESFPADKYPPHNVASARKTLASKQALPSSTKALEAFYRRIAAQYEAHWPAAIVRQPSRRKRTTLRAAAPR